MGQLPLAIFSQSANQLTQTFVKKHLTSLLPGKTLVVIGLPGSKDSEIGTPIHEIHTRSNPNLFNAFKSRVYHYAGYNPDRKKLVKVLRNQGVKVIMSEFLDWSEQWLDVAAELNIPIYAHAHGTDVNSRIREEVWRKKYLKYNESAGIIAVSEYQKMQLVGIGINPEKVFVIPYGVDVMKEFIERVVRDDEQIRCLCVGRMIPCKSPILVLDAFRRASMINHRLRFDYVGIGPYYQAALQFVNATKLNDIVTLHGAVAHDKVKEIYKKSDIYIQHSVSDPETGQAEGLPVSILEAMSYGLPVVATRLTGIPEEVTEEETGFLVEPGDTEAMAQHILQLANDAALRLKLGRAGWLRAGEFFSWERERQQLLNRLGLF